MEEKRPQMPPPFPEAGNPGSVPPGAPNPGAPNPGAVPPGYQKAQPLPDAPASPHGPNHNSPAMPLEGVQDGPFVEPYVLEEPLQEPPRPKKKNALTIYLIIALAVILLAGAVTMFIYWDDLFGGKKSGSSSADEVEKPIEKIDAPLEEEPVPDWETESEEEAAPAEEVVEAPQRGLYGTRYYKGSVSDSEGDYPIRMYLNFDGSGYITGRYAYELTLRKYGDKSSSWFGVSGRYREDSNGSVQLELVTSQPNGGPDFETIMGMTNGEYLGGYLRNMNTGRELQVSLVAER